MPLSFFGQDAFDYEKAWKEIDQLRADRQLRTAAEAIADVLEAANKEGNDPQYIKALLYGFQTQQSNTENSDSLIIVKMVSEASKGSPIRKAILNSMLAQIYYQFLSNNRWRIMNRTELTEEANDFQTWDLQTFAKTITKLHFQALEDRETLQQIPVQDYEVLLHKQYQSDVYRPSLYDILAHAAIDYFNQSGLLLPESRDAFNLDSKAAFLPQNEFLAHNFVAEDPLSPTYNIIRLYQELIKFHKKENNVFAQYDADLKRLDFVKNQSKDQNRFKASLEQLLSTAPKHPVSADIKLTLARLFFGLKENAAIDASNEEKAESRVKALNMCNEIIKEYPKTTAATNAEALSNQILNKNLSLVGEDYAVTGERARFSLSYTNLNRVYFRVITLTQKLEKDLERLRYQKEEKLAALLSKQRAIKSWSFRLPDPGDHFEHSTELGVAELPEGSYLILASDNSAFSITGHALAFMEHRVTNLAHIYYHLDETHHFFALDRSTGAPLNGLESKVYRLDMDKNRGFGGKNHEPKLEETLRTDENGALTIPRKYKRERIYVVFKKDKDSWKAEGQDLYYYGNRNSNLPKRERRQINIFTDRAIYRPGQTIYFKGILVGKIDQEKPYIIQNENLSVQFYNANGQKVSEQVLRTNEFGSLSGTFTAPTGGLNGQMRIQTIHGSHYIRVEDYKRPTFEVKLDTVEGNFTFGDEVEITGLAEAFSGAPISGSEVKYRVVRNLEVPYWYYWRRFPSEPETEIANGSIETDEAGKFSFTFTAEPGKSAKNKQLKPVYRYKLIVDVVDISGETRSSNGLVRISKKSLDVALRVNENSNKKDLQPFEISTNNLNGKFVPTKGKLKIIPLKVPDQTYRKRRWGIPDQFVYSEKEFRKLFPDDVYKEEDRFYNWEEKEAILEEAFDTGKGRTFNPEVLKNAQTGKYKAVFVTDEEEIEAVAYFTLYSPDEKNLPIPTLVSAVATPNPIEPGQTASLRLQTTEKRIWVLYQLMKSDEILDEKWIELKKGEEKIQIPITENYRGNIDWQIGFVYKNEYFSQGGTIKVPWTNKQLKLEWMSFRSPLQPGQKEQWKLKISGPKAEVVASEMVATLYDASLDEFAVHDWAYRLYPTFRGYLYKRSKGFSTNGSRLLDKNWNKRTPNAYQSYDRLNFFGFYFGSTMYGRVRYNRAQTGGFDDGFGDFDGEAEELAAAPMAMDIAVKGSREINRKRKVSGLSAAVEAKEVEKNEDLGQAEEKPGDSLESLDKEEEPIIPRRNLNETAFFFPHLETNEEGEILLNFTIPEALTKWKFLGIAHSQDLKTGKITGETQTQKDLMVIPNLPRFVREGDKMTLTAKVVNMTDSTLTGSAELKLFNALNMKAVDSAFAHGKTPLSVTIAPKGSELVSWEIEVPQNQQAVAVQVFARAGSFTDGEENILPVLTNRMLVTEALPFSMKSKEKKKKLDFVKLQNSASSSTLSHHKLTLDVTSNPAWYAVQALPYLMEYPYECTEQVFSRFYSNALATHIANDKPMIRQVFEQWKTMGQEESFLSNLEKNQDLKYALLEETPWVLNAQNESERKRQIGLLFDLNRMADEFVRTKKILSDRQSPNGGFSWFPGMDESRYITQLIATGMGHLQKLGVNDVAGNPEVASMMQGAVNYLDRAILNDYQRLKRLKGVNLEENHLGYSQIQYLYMRSFYGDIPLQVKSEGYDYYYSQAKTYWNKQSTYMTGMLALVFERNEDKQLAQKLIRGLDESAVKSRDKGMFWKDNKGWFWWQAPIERQALLIEAFTEISSDQEAIDDMRYWLLLNKRTNDWETTRATVAACNALLIGNNDWLGEQQLVEVKLGEVKVDPEKLDNLEAGTGQYQVSWTGEEISPEMGKIQIKKPGKSPAWGGIYWQYFEDLDKITFAETPLSIRKTINKELITKDGPVLQEVKKDSKLKQGDKLIVRIEIRVNQAMEYVHMKDMRAAGLEPINVISRYKYQGGLGYYESTRDAATNFFFGYLPEGTWVFEYPLRVNLPGDYSNGITSIQCMYAPEFTSHSSGSRVTVGAPQR